MSSSRLNLENDLIPLVDINHHDFTSSTINLRRFAESTMKTSYLSLMRNWRQKFVILAYQIFVPKNLPNTELLKLWVTWTPLTMKAASYVKNWTYTHRMKQSS
ncbi:hypothetical protein LXL04_009583 [Taraxacum kok-saghyz]